MMFGAEISDAEKARIVHKVAIGSLQNQVEIVNHLNVSEMGKLHMLALIIIDMAVTLSSGNPGLKNYIVDNINEIFKVAQEERK